MDVLTVADARESCARFAESFPELTLYAAVCRGAAQDDDVAGLLLAARPGQRRTVLLLAALHDLVLARPDLPAARWYPSVTGRPVPDGDPWPDVRAAALTHGAELRAVIAARQTQTNEANRAVHLAALVARATADVPDAPVVLVELGASAGLLLGLDRYRIEVGAPDAPGATVLGDPASPVRCRGELRAGSVAGLGLPRVVGRVGLDLDPVRHDDARELRWLEACLWPDQPDRLERFRAAVAVLSADPPHLVRGDMVADLGRVAAAAVSDGDARAGARCHLVAISSWALTYVDPQRRAGVGDTLAGLAADGRPVSWLTAEPPGCAPGLPDVAPTDPLGEATAPETVLGARTWRDGVELPAAVHGWSHPHGTWLCLRD